MQCPRCAEEIADQSVECPVCHKRLSLDARVNTRTALTGETFARFDPAEEVSTVTVPAPAAAASPAVVEPAPPAPVRLIPTNPERFAPRRRPSSNARARPVGPDLRWLLVAIAAAGVVASAILWYRPYVAPIHVSMQPAGGFMDGGNERPIPAVYLWLWGCYGLLAIATQFLFPAPWRFGPMQMRTNWVLNISTIVALLLFTGTGIGQQADTVFERNVIVNREGGTFEYRDGTQTRSVTAEEAAQIATRIVHDREAAIFRQWNMAALLSFLALGAYCAWWLIERPEAEFTQPRDPDWLIRQARGEAESSSFRGGETVPSESVRTRDTPVGQAPWK